MKRASAWLLRVLHDEVQSAVILFAVAGITVAASLSPLQHQLVSFSEFTLFNNQSLKHFVGEWLLCIFFVIAGIELRHELTLGSLNTVRAAVVPGFAALGGMVIPALIFAYLSPTPNAWGVAMPTDLPFALAVVAIFGRRTSLAFKAFILSLAIVDDALSVIAISLQSGSLQVHPTLIAIFVGLALRPGFAEKVLSYARPLSSGVALPLFAITTLALPITFSDFFNEQSAAFVSARLIGKPLGILIGVAIALLIARGATQLLWKELAAVGFVCSMGFSVSLLFASTAGLTAASLISITAAIVIAIPLSAIAGGVALLTLQKR